jgi:outer membrane protein W
MKNKLQSVFIMAALLSVAPLFADGLEIKGGVGSVKAANDKAGFDAGIAYAYKIERFFAFVPEVNFNWINFDQCATSPCQTATVGGLTSTLTTTRNHYTLPLMLNLRFIVPMGSEDTPAVQPYVTLGAGYAWSFFEAKTPQYTQGAVTTPAATVSDSAAGFMYQGMVGLAFNMGMLTEGSASATNLLIEGGYRGGQVEKNGFKFDMSGYVLRVGAAFNF